MALHPSDEHEEHDLSESAVHTSNNAEQISRRNRIMVLVGCCVLQLPIWGFAVTFGIFQDFYNDHWTFQGSRDSVGLVGMISNGVMYLSMPLLFAGLVRKWAAYRRTAAFCGILLAGVGFMASSFSTNIWHLILTQGILVAFGSVLVYSPTTLALSEHFSSTNRALAYGAVLSCKNVTGSTCPFLLHAMLQHLGFRTTIRVWGGIVVALGALGVYMMPMQTPAVASSTAFRPRKVPWEFLHHRSVYVHAVAIMIQSSGYGIAQTYLSTYAHSTVSLSSTSSTLLLTLFNAPGILASAFFGFLCDNERQPLSSGSITFISSFPATLAALLFWGMAGTAGHALPLLILFAVVYGFFASGYSATWGSVIKEMERDAATRNEAFDSGMVYGILNGARGIGYVGGGLLAVQLLKVSNAGSDGHGSTAYSTTYGPLIIYTGVSTLFGGWSILLGAKRMQGWVKTHISDRLRGFGSSIEARLHELRSWCRI